MIRPFSIHDPAFLANAAGGPSPPVLSWSQRVVANGGAAPSQATLDALDTFYAALVAAGLDSKMIAVNVYAPDSLIACLTPFIVGPGNDPWTNLGGNFTASELTVDGLQGNGTNMGLDTGLILADDVSDNDHGLTLYTFSAIDENKRDAGVLENGGAFQYHHIALASTLLNFNTPDAASTLSVANSTFGGYVCMQRIDATNINAYRANSGTAHALLGTQTNAQTGTLPATYSLYIHGSNEVGSLTFPCTRRLSFAAIHSSFSSTQSSDFFDAIQQLRTDFGGGFV